jgi:hypothetical protein
MYMRSWIKTSIRAWYIMSVIVMSSCVAMSQKHKSNDTYYEDLSLVRPQFINPDTLSSKSTKPTVVANPNFQYDVSKKVTMRIDSLSDINKVYSTMQGYRILVYAGTSSDDAQRNKQSVYTYNSDLNVYTQYKQPSFRVKVGDFTNRVEAHYILNDLKQSFPNAMIVPDQINLLH